MSEADGVLDRGLYQWRNNLVVIVVGPDGDGWFVSRSWLRGDRMEHLRRWRFDNQRQAIGQLRRLVRDASADIATGDAAAEELRRWFVEAEE